MNFSIALIDGDGIGPEQTAAAKDVLSEVQNAFSISFDYIPIEAGDRALARTGHALPEGSLETIRKCDCCLKAPVGETAYEVIIHLRQQLDLYANIRPAKALPNVPSLNPMTDLVIVRENTEDLYAGLESADSEKATATRLITRRASERIAKFAFNLAQTRRYAVTAVHKANVLKKTDGLFLSVCKDVASNYSNVRFSDMYVDAAAMNLIRSPQEFDIILTTNMFGDILSDEAGQVVGGLGLAPSANIGEELAIFEPVHGCAPDIAGTNTANPTSLILSSAMMLNWLGQQRNDNEAKHASQAIQRAVESCLAAGKVTPDLGGKLTTLEMGGAIKAGLSQVVCQ